jgi:hypothetical protein
MGALRRGWCLGSWEFKRQQLEQMEGKLGEHHAGERRRETAEGKAARIVAEELRRLGWAERDLAVRRKSDPEKLAMATRLRKETILPMRKIAQLVGLGTTNAANANLQAWKKQEKIQHGKR